MYVACTATIEFIRLLLRFLIFNRIIPILIFIHHIHEIVAVPLEIMVVECKIDIRTIEQCSFRDYMLLPYSYLFCRGQQTVSFLGIQEYTFSTWENCYVIVVVTNPRTGNLSYHEIQQWCGCEDINRSFVKIGRFLKCIRGVCLAKHEVVYGFTIIVVQKVIQPSLWLIVERSVFPP